MAQYEKVFTKPYEDGYVDLPNQTTPITAETLNDKDTAIEHIEDYLHNNDANGNLADDYDSTATYSIDDYAVYEGVLYRCITAVSTAEDFDDDKWEAVLITDVMGSGSGGSSTLSGLDDVTLSSPANGQVLKFDSTLNKWKNANESGGGGGTGGVMKTYHADWTATSSSAIKTKLTDEVTLPKGKYIAIARTPYSTLTDTISLSFLSNNDYLDMNLVDYAFTSSGEVTFYFELSESKNVSLCSCTSSTKTWDSTYLARGGLDIVSLESGGIDIASIYSTEEREIGCWVDGKPLYQKTIDFGALPNATSKSVAHGISNLGRICKYDCVAINTNDNVGFTPPMPISLNNTTSNLIVTFDATNINFNTGINLSSYNDCKVILEYTKTTDTPGSGTWTPNGNYAEHYSTAEQVIGTWIDGSTLYEKTYDVSANPLNIPYDTWVNVGATDANNVIMAIALCNGLVENAIEARVNNGYIQIQRVGANSSSSRSMTHCIVRYTKS